MFHNNLHNIPNFQAKQLSFQSRKHSVDKSNSSESVPKLIDSVTSVKMPSSQTEANESTENKLKEPQKIITKVVRSSTPSDSGKSPRPDANEEPLTG